MLYKNIDIIMHHSHIFFWIKLLIYIIFIFYRIIFYAVHYYNIIDWLAANEWVDDCWNISNVFTLSIYDIK